ncbi:MAG TPA: hypothetical protein VGI42_03645 [Chthoniobacterales bacterium]|jgi:hypothetical protein
MNRAALARLRTGRAILHLLCIVRRPRTAAFQFAGIQREILEPIATIGNGGPLLPIGILLAAGVMTWFCLR